MRVGGMLVCLDLTGSCAPTGTTPLGFGIRRSSSTEGDQCLKDHHGLMSVGICGKTPQSICGSRSRPRDGRRRDLFGEQLPTLELQNSSVSIPLFALSSVKDRTSSFAVNQFS